MPQGRLRERTRLPPKERAGEIEAPEGSFAAEAAAAIYGSLAPSACDPTIAARFWPGPAPGESERQVCRSCRLFFAFFEEGHLHPALVRHAERDHVGPDYRGRGACRTISVPRQFCARGDGRGGVGGKICLGNWRVGATRGNDSGWLPCRDAALHACLFSCLVQGRTLEMRPLTIISASAGAGVNCGREFVVILFWRLYRPSAAKEKVLASNAARRQNNGASTRRAPQSCRAACLH